MSNKYIIFDLDDTLTYEIDYLKSAYQEIATKLGDDSLYSRMFDMYSQGENVFEYLSNHYNITLPELLDMYRNHYPSISLIEGAKEVLQHCKTNGYKLGLISDGRSVTQRNKLKALNIEEIFESIIISEEFGSAKPDEKSYLHFIEKDINSYLYIADNTKKDFVTPNRLGWTTVCLLDKGHNIHRQSFEVESNYLPQYKIESLTELISIIK